MLRRDEPFPACRREAFLQSSPCLQAASRSTAGAEMARYELLNNVTHKDLRVVTRFGREFGDDIGMVLAFPTEYAELQREYPIFFRKDRDSGEWQSVALLGFEQQGKPVPAGRPLECRLPAGRGRQGAVPDRLPGTAHRRRTAQGAGHPRRPGASARQFQRRRAGVPAAGRATVPTWNTSSTVLRGIRDGMEAGKAMFAAFDRLGLIQPVESRRETRRQAPRRAWPACTASTANGWPRLDADVAASPEPAPAISKARILVLASMHNMRRLMAEKQRRLRSSRRSRQPERAA